jgi:cob(I)alamin adenosyltransferase
MPDKAFRDPKLSLNRIYTRTGDGGETRLVGGQKVAKDDLRLDCYGTVDELNAFIGAACLASREDARTLRLSRVLLRVQHELFNLGSALATLAEDLRPQQPQITDRDVKALERDIDEANAALPPLRSFVLPGGSELNVQLHIARTVCRRAERLVVALRKQQSVADENIRYLNRLSDALFVWSRWANAKLEVPEVLWDPNLAASGEPAGSPQVPESGHVNID